MTTTPPPAATSIEVFKVALQTLPSASRISDEDAEIVYGIAYQLLVQARPLEAMRYFMLLALYRPTNTKYLSGMARTFRLLERPREAMEMYSLLVLLEPSEIHHSLAVAECLLMMRQADEARDLVDLVIQGCKASSSTAVETLERARAIAKLIGARDVQAS